MVGFGLGLAGILWGALLPVAATGLLICVTQSWLIAPRVDWGMLQPSLRYTLPLIGLSLAYALGGKLDRLMLECHVQLAAVAATLPWLNGFRDAGALRSAIVGLVGVERTGPH